MTVVLIVAATLAVVYAATAAWMWYGFRRKFSL